MARAATPRTWNADGDDALLRPDARRSGPAAFTVAVTGAPALRRGHERERDERPEEDNNGGSYENEDVEIGRGWDLH